MCGRITQDVTDGDLADLYGLDEEPCAAVPKRWNGAPTQDFSLCRAGRNGRPAVARHRWGLVPRWAKDTRFAARLINARSETVDTKPSFRAAFRRRRCLVPVNGWFEWERAAGRKQPWWISLGPEPFSLAGLWEVWERGPEPLHTFTVLTRAAVPELRWLHHRQPVIVGRDRYAAWLDPATPQPEALELARAPARGPFHQRRVSALVNRVANDSPEVLRPA